MEMDRDGGSLVVEWYKHNHRNNDFHNMAASLIHGGDDDVTLRAAHENVPIDVRIQSTLNCYNWGVPRRP